MSVWVCIPDLQVPDHDAKAVASVTRFIEWLRPDGLVLVGDELDAPEPSRWNRSMAGEYAGTLQKSINQCHEILAGFRQAAGSAPIHLMRSNHGERIRTYIRRYAPALESLESLEYQRLLGLDELNVTYHQEPYEFVPGWLLAHGDEGGLNQTAGGTALGLAKKWGMSVCAGHTHRAGLQHQHLAVNGKVRRHIFGLEAGHLMDMRKAGYLKAGSANWQQAIALFEVEGKRVTPTLLPIFGSTVTYQGRSF